MVPTVPMKIALVGYGAMGKMVSVEAQRAGHTVVSRIDPKDSEASHRTLSKDALAGADLVIDFSLPGSVLSNIEFYCGCGAHVVMGTTGWTGELARVEALVRDAGIRFLWSSNFSLGVQAYVALIERAAQIFRDLTDYDVWGYEVHHRHKVDSPSGTAKTIAGVIAKNMARKSTPVYEKMDRRLEPQEFHFGSVRGGEANFEHTVAFDSGPDTILIKHAARSREGYARGAVFAGQWLMSQPPGFYGIDNLMRQVLGESI